LFKCAVTDDEFSVLFGHRDLETVLQYFFYAVRFRLESSL
jgi:hypothetical protein